MGGGHYELAKAAAHGGVSLADIKVLYENDDPSFVTFAWKVVSRVHAEISQARQKTGG